MKIIRWIVLIVCGAILGFNIYNINANRLMRNQLPMPFGYGMATVLSGSMEPEFSKGDLLIVGEPDELKINDIVVFEDGSSLVVHRIIDIQDETLVTKGDANNVADEPITKDAVRGTVIACIPSVGAAIDFIKTPIGTILTIALAILFLELPVYMGKRQDDEELESLKEEIRRLKEDVIK